MKKKGIIERLVMGKEVEKDFLESDLPSTRYEQFKFILKTRTGMLLRVNLLAAIFFLPLIVWAIISGAYVSDFVKGLDAKAYADEVLSLSILQYGTAIPLFMLGFCGLSGAFYVIRRIAWGQSVKVVQDFFKGVKDSFLPFILLGFITGFINFAVHYIAEFSLLSMTQGNMLLWAVTLCLAILFYVVWCVALMFATAQSSLYKTTFTQLLINSYIMTFKRLLKSFAICIVSLAPIIIFAFMPWLFVKIIGACLVLVFLIGFAVTVQTVYCHGVFDKFINEKDYPDFVGMGLSGGKVYEQAADNVTKTDGDAEENL